MARLKAVRVLQEKAAEQDLAVARFAAKTAADHLRNLGALQVETRQQLSVGLEAGDRQGAYICMLEEGLQKASRPVFESLVVAAQGCCARMETIWLHARREHASIHEIVRHHYERRQKLQERAAQSVADELYRSGRERKKHL
jgi:flagellar export protein FliJ